MSIVSNVREREFNFSEENFQDLSKIVYNRTGIVISDRKKNMVYGRLAKRIRHLKMKNFSDYISFINSNDGDEEAINFINAITTNLTKFFRENHHFEHMRNKILKPMLESSISSRKVRIWSAGCSSGMEAYSIAMTIAETIPNIAGWDFKILATDIDTNMLEKGRNGIYKNKDIDNVPDGLAKKYFKKYDSENVIISEKLRKMVHFKMLNLLNEEWPMQGKFDIIFCRNVVIYFDAKTQSDLFCNYHNKLKKRGWLYIGHSETLLDATNLFKTQGRTIFMSI